MILLFLTRLTIQQDSAEAVDTLTTSYGNKWEGAAGLEQSGAFIQAMGSNDLIFVVLAVSLIIWLVLLFFLVRLDRKVSTLEQNLNDKQPSGDL
ncbi:MAG: hypothetical protein U5K31_03820 [Balneolaceae bacterium]|nr:hypothetical protein [Balneolaceae bacterium]